MKRFRVIEIPFSDYESFENHLNENFKEYDLIDVFFFKDYLQKTKARVTLQIARV